MGHGDDCIIIGDQVLHGHIIIISDAGLSIVPILIGDHLDLFFDHHQQLFLICQDPSQFLDLSFQLLVLIFQLLSLQTGESPQTHVHDRLGLRIRQLKAVHQPFLCLRRVRGAADDLDHLIDVVQGL